MSKILAIFVFMKKLLIVTKYRKFIVIYLVFFHLLIQHNIPKFYSSFSKYNSIIWLPLHKELISNFTNLYKLTFNKNFTIDRYITI